jgi:hypothetical protein
MPYVAQVKLAEIVPDFWAKATREASAEVCATLNRLADRYAAMAVVCPDPTDHKGL